MGRRRLSLSERAHQHPPNRRLPQHNPVHPPPNPPTRKDPTSTTTTVTATFISFCILKQRTVAACVFFNFTAYALFVILIYYIPSGFKPRRLRISTRLPHFTLRALAGRGLVDLSCCARLVTVSYAVYRVFECYAGGWRGILHDEWTGKCEVEVCVISDRIWV